MTERLENHPVTYPKLPEWERWIWERIHGMDTVSKIPLIRDPNPHFAVLDAYFELKTDTSRKSALNVLINLLQTSLMKCKEYGSAKNSDEFQNEALALDRLLQIFDKLNTEDFERVKILRNAIRASKACYTFVRSNLVGSEYGLLQRHALAVRTHLGDRLTESELVDALDNPSTYVVGFRYALRRYDIDAIGRYFPQFVNIAIQINNLVSVKVELLRTRDVYATDPIREQRIVLNLEDAIAKLSLKAREVVEKAAADAGFVLFSGKPVRVAIHSRKSKEESRGILRVIEELYVKSDAYVLFVDDIINKLCEMNNAVRQAVKLGPWDQLASDIVMNEFDFLRAPYFNCGPRRHLIDVVKTGSVDTFTCLYNKDKLKFDLWHSSLSDTSLSFKERLIGLLKSTAAKIEIGLCGGTAAALEVQSALREETQYHDRTARFMSTDDLVMWIKENSDSGIIVCDHGIAEDIISALNSEQRNVSRQAHFSPEAPRYSYGGTEKVIHGFQFDYARPIPTGFVYPRLDYEWGEQIKEAMAISLNKHSGNWEQITSDLKKAGIKLFSVQKLSDRLGLTSDAKVAKKSRALNEA